MRRRRILSVHEQLPRMKSFPGFRAWVVGPKLIAEGEVQPLPLSASYRVRIEYEAADYPRVWVLAPKLLPRDESPIPHMYNQERLCLYLPGAGQWSGELSLAHVVIPWISLWLHHYELWHATGEWLGGGVEPNIDGPYLREGKPRTYE